MSTEHDQALPTFLLIGATKAGTTSLHWYLSRHPQVFMHPTKELRFFSAEHNWHRGVDWYRAQFADHAAAMAIGEASNSYTRHPVYAGVPERIHRVIPEAKLVYVLRDPVKRLYSHYLHRLATGREWRDLAQAIEADPSYLAASRYAAQITQYLACFPISQLCIIRAEDLDADPQGTLATVFRFLGVDDGVAIPPVQLNVSAERYRAPMALRQLSRAAPMRPLVARLMRRLGRHAHRLPFHLQTIEGGGLDEALRARLLQRLDDDLQALRRLAPHLQPW
ncbi:MAG: sulfotransferase [Pseudomonadota bacterium]